MAESRRARLFLERYGPWGVVAGGSQGIGAAFVRRLAARGLNVAAAARSEEKLDELAGDVQRSYETRVRTIRLDLSGPDAAEQLDTETADLDVGVLVYNAAVTPLGSFLGHEQAELDAALAVNTRTPARACHGFARRFAGSGSASSRRRGGIVLMASLAGLTGSPHIALYAATKAFNIALASGLGPELRRAGIDILASCAGATATPGFMRTRKGGSGILAMSPEDVAEQTLRALGGTHRYVPGAVNKLGSVILKLLPAPVAVRMLGQGSRSVMNNTESWNT